MSQVQTINREDLEDIPTPARTTTWKPVSHHRVLELVLDNIMLAGFDIAWERHELRGPGGAEWFGTFQLSPFNADGPADQSALACVARNSHTKKFAVGLGVGSHVMNCSNLSFWADHTIKRRHMGEIDRDLPQMVETLFNRAQGQWDEIRAQEARMRQHRMPKPDFAELLMWCIRFGVLPGSKASDAIEEWYGWWDNPRETYPSVWRAVNAINGQLQKTSMSLLTWRTMAINKEAVRYMTALETGGNGNGNGDEPDEIFVQPRPDYEGHLAIPPRKRRPEPDEGPDDEPLDQ